VLRHYKRALTSVLLVAVCLVGGYGCSMPTFTGTTYYVSPSGDDKSSGTSPSRAWRTAGKAGVAAVLRPGDRVLFEGGHAYGELAPIRSGSTSGPILYGSYGGARASFTNVWLNSVSNLAFKDLLVVSGSGDGIGGSGSGTGAANITIYDVEISGTNFGVHTVNQGDYNWTVAASYIHDVGDSGVLLEGPRAATVAGNRIWRTGKRYQGWGAHGVYSKANGARIVGNDIGWFSMDGISTRRRNALIEANLIHDGPSGPEGGEAIGYYNYDPTEASGQGTSTVRFNRSWNLGGPFIYIDRGNSGGDSADGMPENWRIYSNDISGNYPVAIHYNWGTTAHHGTELVIFNNVIAGRFDTPIFVSRAPATYVNDRNVVIPTS
jgi:hypothetical protein